jgi:hypothetical protein
MELDEVKKGVEVIVPKNFTPKEEWPITKVKSVPYKIGNGPWICLLENNDKVEIKKLIKI